MMLWSAIMLDIFHDWILPWHLFKREICINLLFVTFSAMLNLQILRLLSRKAQGLKHFEKLYKPCHVGIHWTALAEYYHMSSNMPGFQSFFRYFA